MSGPDEMVIGRIIIERVLTSHGDDIVQYRATRGDDEEALPVLETLGMLALAEDSVLHHPDNTSGKQDGEDGA